MSHVESTARSESSQRIGRPRKLLKPCAFHQSLATKPICAGVGDVEGVSMRRYPPYTTLAEGYLLNWKAVSKPSGM